MNKGFKIENWEQFSKILAVFATVMHRICVEFDDTLCHVFGFSRKARGKHVDSD